MKEPKAEKRRGSAVAYVIAEPCIGTKDRACVDVMPSGLHSSEENRAYDDGRPRFDWGK